MKNYLIAMHQPVGGPPPTLDLDAVMRQIYALRSELQERGSWVFGAGLHEPDRSTVLRRSGDDVLVTDGPYVEGKEHLGGITIVSVADLDEALAIARRYAQITGLPIELRPFQGDAD